MALVEQHPRAIPAVDLCTRRAAMLHVPKHLIGVEHDLVRRASPNVGYKPNTACVVLVVGVVETKWIHKHSERRDNPKESEPN